MDSFGSTDPMKMPRHFFGNAFEIDHATAVRANIVAQDYSVAPRHWYIDARFRCARCDAEFLWSAQEQRQWFETYRFWIDSTPRLCHKCQTKRKHMAVLRKDYDAHVASARSCGTTEQKNKIIQIIDELEETLGKLPQKMIETRDLFRKQVNIRNSVEPPNVS